MVTRSKYEWLAFPHDVELSPNEPVKGKINTEAFCSDNSSLYLRTSQLWVLAIEGAQVQHSLGQCTRRDVIRGSRG